MNDEQALVVTERNTTVMLGTIAAPSPLAVIGQATELADALARIITDRELFTTLRGKKYVRVEGWSTLGAMLGVLPREVDATRLEDGSYLGVVELVRVNDGAVIGRASALCGMDEKDRKGNLTWGSRAEYARRSMAVTRATGKAYRLGFSWIMALAGYEPTPAEEMVIEGEYTEQLKRKEPTTRPIGQAALNETHATGAAGETAHQQPSGNWHSPNPGTKTERPYNAENIRDKLQAGIADKREKKFAYADADERDKRRWTVQVNLEKCFAGDSASTEKRHLVSVFVTGAASSKDWDDAEIETWRKWLGITKNEDTGEYSPGVFAISEAHAMAKAAAIVEGQQELF